MKHTFAARRFGAAKWALLLSSIGFTFALFTSTSPGASATATGVLPRVLATNCTRLPTEFVTAPDLGAVVAGSQFTRQILVLFGFRPHTFKFGQFGAFGGAITISDAGKLQGKFTDPGLNIFEVVVSDGAAGIPPQPISRLFFLNAVPQQFSEAPLHFESGLPIAFGTTAQTITLPTAVSGDSYFCSIQPNGGVPPYTTELLAQTGVRFLPQGLAYDTTNLLFYGKPALPTPVGSPAKITMLLSDSAGRQVTGTFLLNIIQGTITSQAVATAGNMSLNFGNNHLFDTLQLTLILDKSELNALGIHTPADLNGLPIQMNFGGFKLPPDKQPNSNTKIITTFNAAGEISVPPRHLVLGDVVGSGVKDVVYTIKLDPKTGILTAKFKNISMINTIGAKFLSFEGQDQAFNRGPVIPINIKIGLKPNSDLAGSSNDVLDKTDVIKFVYKRQGSIGHGTARLNDNLAPAGIFLINKVSGTERQVLVDANNNIRADRIFLQMKGLMRQPGAQPVVPKPTDSVSIFINRLCLGTFPVSSFAAMGDKLIFASDDPTKGLKDLVIDNKKGTVLITTNGLDPANQLFGVDVLNAGDPQTIPITLTISGPDIHNPTFDGQSTVTLFRKGAIIMNK